MAQAVSPAGGPGETRPTGRDVRIGQALVAVQVVLLLAVALAPRGWSLPVPAAVLVGGLGLAGVLVMFNGAFALRRGLTAAPLPNRHAQLRTGGSYALVRHPIYTGLLTATAALVVLAGGALRLGAWLALLLVITAKARWEEGHLAARFPGYRAYAAQTPRFLPRLRARRPKRD